MRKAPFECPQDRLRQAQGERIWEARVRWGVGDAMGWETPRAAPLWIPAFAGMTRAEGPLRVPSGQASTGSGRTDLGGAPLVGSGGAMGDGDAPRLAPLDSCLRRNDAHEGVREIRGAQMETSPRLAPAPGFPLSRERRWGCGGLARVAGDGVRVPLSRDGHHRVTSGQALREPLREPQGDRDRESRLRIGLAFGDPRQSPVVGAPRPSGFLPSQECREGGRLGS